MKHFRRGLELSVLLTGVALIFLGCTANVEPSKLETKLANMAKEVVIPMEAKNRKNPLPANKEIIEQGRELYMQSCAICHGADGRSRTNIGRGMYPPAMDLTSPTCGDGQMPTSSGSFRTASV
ncbi:MAG: hypothetical protein HY508_05685 [Acidobacteria bacterium]|nr:hypothetical protein [Acidobacteriota bacterium]